MINPTEISKAIEQRLKNAPALQDVDITRDDYVNTNPAFTPWIGVYRTSVDIEPYTIGRGGWWKGTVEVDIACQASVAGSGAKTGEALDDLVQNVLAAVFVDSKFGNAVLATMSYSVQYEFQRSESETMDHQQATITLQMDFRTNG